MPKPRAFNWSGVVAGLVVLGLVVGDLALLGETAVGYVGVGVVVAVMALILRFDIARRVLHR